MRKAQLVGLSQDGQSLIVATDRGDEVALAVDQRLYAVLRDDRPRLGQLEIQMEASLGPRDIQARIRSGQSLEEVTRVAGMPLDRVERFAAPVLAERDHVASLAMASTVRRRGETSGHRNLRLAMTERLVARGVDIDTITWDSYRTEDGRWAVTADYASGGSHRQAMFLFDVPGRFSVAGNDEARWVLGEQTAIKGPQPGRKRPAPAPGDELDDTEPTLDLNDELALVRVVSDEGPPTPSRDTPDQHPNEGAGSGSQSDPGGFTDASAVPETATGGWEPAIVVDYPVEPSPVEKAQPPDEEPEGQGAGGSQPGGPEPTERVVEPVSDAPDRPEAPTAIDDRREENTSAPEAAEHTEHTEPTVAKERPGTATPPGAQAETSGDSPAEDAASPGDDSGTQASKTPKRKRAAVPSWDEIMFGGPKP